MSGVRPPWSSRLVDAVVFGFALWTVCCHVVVAAGGTLPLLIATALVAAAAFLLRPRLPRPDLAELPPSISLEELSTPASALLPGPQSPPTDAVGSSRRWSQGLSLFGVAAGLVGVGIFGHTGNILLLWWWGALLLLIAGGAILLLETPRTSPPLPPTSRETPLLLAVAAACVLITLMSHRPDYDDALYINFAVAAVDHLDLPLLEHDTLHGIKSLPLHLAAYEFHSWELWNAALAQLTGLPAMTCFHLLSAALAAALVPLAHARLFRLLLPRRAMVAVAVLAVVLLAAGETHRWYGNFSFVRLWQGKGVALFIFLPLIYAYALELARAPTRRGWMLLAAAQVAAVGCTSSAIWLAPAGALTALCCGLPPTRRGLTTFAWGALASGYPLLIGWLLVHRVQDSLLPGGGVLHNFGKVDDELRQALAAVLGNGNLLPVCLAAVFGAWALTPPGSLARRFAVGFPLAVWWVLLNPYLANWVVLNVSGTGYWRCLWALPIPLLLTLVIVAPLEVKARRRGGPFATAATSLLLLVGFMFLVPSDGGLSPENRVTFHKPGFKVRSDTYRMAKALRRGVPAGSFVVAPETISLWLPTFHDHPFPLKVRHYLDLPQMQARIGEDSFRQRDFLTRYVANEARPGENDEQFLDSLGHFAIRGVCLERSVRSATITAWLEAEDFYLFQYTKKYEVWVRRKGSPPPDTIFRDDFESGDVSAWKSDTVLPEGP